MNHRPAKLEEVVIERFGQDVRILYRDHPFEGGLAMRLGRERVRKMSDQDILDMFNQERACLSNRKRMGLTIVGPGQRDK